MLSANEIDMLLKMDRSQPDGQYVNGLDFHYFRKLLDSALHWEALKDKDNEAQSKFARAVNGWKQALSIIRAQHAAIRWCQERFAEMKVEGRLESSPEMGKSYHETVVYASNVGERYIAAMDKAEAL